MSETNTFWMEGAMAHELSDSEKQLRDRFVEEYVFDFDRIGAALRIGFLPSFALEWSQKFLDESYVRAKIKELTKAKAEDEAKEEEETKRRIRASLLKEANYRGAGSSHAARVGALSKLASFYGMDAPIKTQQELTHRGGVMAVPGIASVEDWESKAVESQNKLQSDSEV